MTRQWFQKEADRLREEYRQRVIHKMVASYEHKIEVIEAAALHVQRHFRGIAARRRVLKERRRRAAIHIQRIARGLMARKRVLDILTVLFDWMLVSSLVLSKSGEENTNLGCLRHFAEHMLGFARKVHRFKWLHEIKALSAILIQKVARGKTARKRVVHIVKARVEKLAFGPEIRRLRASMPAVPRQTGSRCLRKIEIIIIKKHVTLAAQYVQRCYRGRLGRRFMHVLRGHSNMSRIRRVMMPIVLRANAPSSRSGMSSSDDISTWPKQALMPSRSAESRRPSSVGDHLHGRRPRTRDVLVQPGDNFVSLRSMVNKFADEHAIELPDHVRGGGSSLPPIQGAVDINDDGDVSHENMHVPDTANLMQPRPGMAWT